MIICAFYTEKTPYEDMVDPFVESVKKTNPNIKVDVRAIPNQGSWELNCGIKPRIILEALNNFQDDVLYIDIDSEVVGEIDLPAMEEDVSIYHRFGELLSGTLYFRNTDGSKNILKKWIESQKIRPYKWDQRTLQNLIQRDNIPYHKMDWKFCYILDKKNKGQPVIVHKQASRVNKRIVGAIMDTIPNVIGKMRIVKNIDGTVAIPRKNREAEKWLDENMEREAHQLRWHPKLSSKDSVEKLILPGKTIYIIGKGPSLSNVTAKTFKNKRAPVFCVNESIHIIEELNLPNDVYVVVQDKEIKNDCIPSKGAGLICASALSNFYPDIENKFTFIPSEFHTHWNYTPIIAINIAKKFGITDFKMIGFDYFKNGDTSYAKEFGYQHARKDHPDRYKNNKAGIKNALIGVKSEFIYEAEEIDDKPQQVEDTHAQDSEKTEY